MNFRRLNMFAFLLAISAITYWHIKKCKELPWPPQYIYTALVFALLDIFSFLSEELASVTSIGFVIAIFVAEGDPVSKVTKKPTWIKCEHGGTGQPQTTGFIDDPNKQPPTTASLTEFQNQQDSGPGNIGSGGTTGGTFV